MKTRGIVLALVLIAAGCYAQDAVWPAWYSNRPSKKITFHYPEIPASSVDLLLTTLKDPEVLKYNDDIWRQQILKSYPHPDLTLVLGVRYLGTNAPYSMHVMLDVFPFETICCAYPDGRIQRKKIPPVEFWRGSMPMPSPVRLGDRFYYPSYWRTAEEWFGPMNEEGPYRIWWERQGSRSNTLLFIRYKSELKLIE